MNSIAIVYDNENELKMKNELSSLEYQGLSIDFINEIGISLNHKILITDKFSFCEKYKMHKIVLIVSNYKEKIFDSHNLIHIQYESKNIKDLQLFNFKCTNNVINCIPEQYSEIKPLKTQNNIIYFYGKDKPENMVDELFDLDEKTHYGITVYGNDFPNGEPTVEPSKLHRLSWNVTNNENLKGIIQYKIIREIENGCLPILLKEYQPSYFIGYPFSLTLDELKDKELLIEKVKGFSHYISKMTRDEFAILANAIYNGIYYNTYWKYEYYIIAERIKLYQ